MAIDFNLERSLSINSMRSGAVVLVGGGGGTRVLKGISVSDDMTHSNWRNLRKAEK